MVIGGGPGGDGHLFMLAKVAGVDHSKMHTAFKGDATLKTDFANVKTTHQALIACLVSGRHLRQPDYRLCQRAAGPHDGEVHGMGGAV